jgi:hypothetical protein
MMDEISRPAVAEDFCGGSGARYRLSTLNGHSHQTSASGKLLTDLATNACAEILISAHAVHPCGLLRAGFVVLF